MARKCKNLMRTTSDGEITEHNATLKLRARGDRSRVVKVSGLYSPARHCCEFESSTGPN